MLFMCCILCGLLYSINLKGKFITMNTIKQFNVSDLNKLFFWQNLLPKESAVSSAVSYQLVKENTYTNGSNQVLSLLDGVVTKVNESSIIVLCDNGVTMHYEKMKKVSIKKDERIKKGTQVGLVENNIVLRFYLDDVEITMDKAVSIT